MPTRTQERLAKQRAETQQELATLEAKLAQLDAQQRAEDRKELEKRRRLVGTLADKAGLLAWDDATLAQIFALLTPLVEMANPVAVLEGCLSSREVEV